MSIEDQKAELIKSLRDIQTYHPIEIPLWLNIVFLGLISLIVFFWIYFRFFKKETLSILSNFDLSIQRLNELNIEKRSRDFYLAYSEILKRYLEIELKLDVLDRTTSELRLILQSCEFLTSAQSLILVKLLERADMAKFAKLEFSSQEKQEDKEKALELIQKVKEAKEKLFENKLKEPENELR
jgi:hypothetical protein